tara:strand:+ start:2155 stop:2406 length:252 start_codon:yes stop_codon:yes gene_type:complete
MAQYKTATPIAASTRATAEKNKGVMIVNDGSGKTEADINLFTIGNGTTEVVVNGNEDHNPIIIPCTLYSTGGTQSNCTVYELT